MNILKLCCGKTNVFLGNKSMDKTKPCCEPPLRVIEIVVFMKYYGYKDYKSFSKTVFEHSSDTDCTLRHADRNTTLMNRVVRKNRICCCTQYE
jgi:hypothetical protein